MRSDSDLVTARIGLQVIWSRAHSSGEDRVRLATGLILWREIGRQYTVAR